MTKKIVGGFPRRNKSLTCPEFQTTPSGLRCDCCEITGVDAKMKEKKRRCSKGLVIRVSLFGVGAPEALVIDLIELMFWFTMASIVLTTIQRRRKRSSHDICLCLIPSESHMTEIQFLICLIVMSNEVERCSRKDSKDTIANQSGQIVVAACGFMVPVLVRS
ncbi:hypothetical protein YC2023_017306 [Brassica napus]